MDREEVGLGNTERLIKKFSPTDPKTHVYDLKEHILKLALENAKAKNTSRSNGEGHYED